MKFQIATAAAALLFIVAAWAVAEPQRTAALTGASIAGSTALVSIVALGRAARSKRNATLAALAVVVVLFLVRLVLVGVGTVLVGKSGATAFLHSLRRSGTPA